MTARTHHCRACTKNAGQPTRTRQTFAHRENGDGRRPVDNWVCTHCGLVLLTMGDVPDSDGLVLHALRQALRRFGRDPGYDWQEEAFLELRCGILVLYQRRWKPELQPSFLAYATTMLRNLLIDWERANKGRDTPKPLAVADSLDRPLGTDNDHTLMDELPLSSDGLAELDSVINVRALTPRSRLFHEHVAKPAVEDDLTLEEQSARLGWSRAQLLRSRSVYYAEVRAQVAA